MPIILKYGCLQSDVCEKNTSQINSRSNKMSAFSMDWPEVKHIDHYCDVIMNMIASQITSLSIVYLTVNSGTDQRKHQSSAPLAFVRGIHRRPVNSPHKGPVTRKMFPFDDVIMWSLLMYKCVIEMCHHLLRLWHVACLAPSHWLIQCGLLDNWAIDSKQQWNFNCYSR